MTSKERINQRFAKDFNLPINIFKDDMFEYYHTLYDFWPQQEWIALNMEIVVEYGGNMDAWLQHYAEVRDTIIRTLEESEAYKAFNASDMSKYAIDPKLRNIPDRNIYNQELVGHVFVSFDLKKANFQALKYAGVLTDDTYEDMIDRFDKSFYFKKSKYTRQVIFGKLNPKRTITVEHYMMSQILGMEFEEMKANNARPVAFKSDEIVWELDYPIHSDILRKYEERIKNELHFEVRAECFTIEKLPIVNVHGNDVTAYVRSDVNTGEEVLKGVSTIYFPQVYKMWKGIPRNERDLMFFFEDQPAHFDHPLKFWGEDGDIPF